MSIWRWISSGLVKRLTRNRRQAITQTKMVQFTDACMRHKSQFANVPFLWSWRFHLKQLYKRYPFVNTPHTHLDSNIHRRSNQVYTHSGTHPGYSHTWHSCDSYASHRNTRPHLKYVSGCYVISIFQNQIQISLHSDLNEYHIMISS